jgi:hypothetical protein
VRDVAVSVFESMRRRYRHARTVTALRRASASARSQGLRVVHMLHVGKTGGIAVKTALETAEIPPGLRLLLHGHGISLRNVPAGDEVFLFLRDPVARFVSGFEMRRREGHPRRDRAWTAAEQRAFRQFGSAQALAMGLRSSNRSERAEAQRAMRSISHVRTHLTDWLASEAEVRSRQRDLVFIGWQESLDAAFRVLVSLLGLPPTTSLPSDPYGANRAPADDLQRTLSADAVEIMRAWYAEDYKLIALLGDLGLAKPHNQRVPAMPVHHEVGA